jgi:N-acetylglucosaminyldiphosphoundecaprenol N-acetyl-beta-D-mannosaminyltransferase
VSIPLLGLNFADLSVPEAAAAILSRPAGAPFRYVVTPNAEHLVRLSRLPGLSAAYRMAWLRLLDSRVVAGAARARGLAAPTVCPGSDLTSAILARLPPETPVTVIGGTGTALARLGLSHAAYFDPPLGFIHDRAATIEAVRFALAHPAHLTFLALGSPRQELLALALQMSGRATGTGLCIGSSLAFASKELPRAPAWMQAAGLEWAHRLACEPRRLWRRYLLDSPKIFQLLWQERAG